MLYRPLGLAELLLVARAGWRAWPPRLPEQPVFYPVLSFEYAQSIARDWNAKDHYELSLVEARRNFMSFGASGPRTKEHVRPALPDEI